MDFISGARGTGNILQDKRVVDMAKEIALLEPDAAPLTVFMKRAKDKVKEAINPAFNWLEDELAPRWDAVNMAGDYNDSVTTIVVDNGDYFKAGDVIKFPTTGEQMLVTAVSTNSLTVSRGWGSTAAAAGTDDDAVLIIANVSEEGSTSPTPASHKEVKKTNYTQIIKTPFQVTNTEDASEMYGGKDKVYQQKLAGIEHKKDLELAMLFGEKKEDTSGSHPKRFTAGLNSFISSNRTDAGGALTEAEFETFCRSIFRYGKSTKMFMASPLIISAINSWASGKLNMVPKDKTYGISVKEYLTGHGTLMLVKHNLLEQEYAGYGFAVDGDNVKFRPLRGRDTKLETNIQAPDSDTKKDQYITEAGLQVDLEKTHGCLYGVTSYS